MKKNILATMDRLEIDERMRNLISQLWKHCYQTTNSCEGHGLEAYVVIKEGDGWFDDHALTYGLYKVENGDCCSREFEKEVQKYELDPKSLVDKRKVCGCGAGVNGYFVYRGILKEPLFK